jgi:hypothetical protein
MALFCSASPAAVFELSNLLPKGGQGSLDPVPIRVAGLAQHAVVLLFTDIPSIPAVFPNGKPFGVTGVMELFRKHDNL